MCLEGTQRKISRNLIVREQLSHHRRHQKAPKDFGRRPLAADREMVESGGLRGAKRTSGQQCHCCFMGSEDGAPAEGDGDGNGGS